MTYLLRKLAGALVEPSTLLALWLGAAAVLVLLTHHGHGGHRRRMMARVMVLVGGVALLLVGYGVPFYALGQRFEEKYAPLPRDAAAVRALFQERVGPAADSVLIAVLGSGISVREGWAHEAWLTRGNVPRTIEGVRLALAVPRAQLLFTANGPGWSTHTIASVSRTVAMELGVDSTRIVVNPRPRTTEDEARVIAEVANGRPVVLVTSALHMHRAMRLLQREGVWALAAPTDFTQHDRFARPVATEWKTWLPRWRALEYADRVMHEGAGLLAMRYFGD
jgi:uncharacterized SAM-binding protein YcdF (DUF218 family)